MMDDGVRSEADDFSAPFADEIGFATAWALLWLISETERHAVALALISGKNNGVVGADSLELWAEPQMVAFRRGQAVPMIPWGRVARILRDHLPANEG